MHPIASILSILGALALGAISPGPSFLFVTCTSVAVSRGAGVAVAAGMGLGASLISVLALLGVRAVLSEAEWLYKPGSSGLRAEPMRPATCIGDGCEVFDHALSRLTMAMAPISSMGIRPDSWIMRLPPPAGARRMVGSLGTVL